MHRGIVRPSEVFAVQNYRTGVPVASNKAARYRTLARPPQYPSGRFRFIEGVLKLGLRAKRWSLERDLREPRVLRQGLLGPARWVTREVLAVTPMVFPTRREAANNFLL